MNLSIRFRQFSWLQVSLILLGMTLTIVFSATIPKHQLNVNLLAIAVALLAFVCIVWPFFPMIVVYPLIWPWWSYNIPLIGGRPERLIAIMGIIGITLTLLKTRQRLPSMPLMVNIGSILLASIYVLSGIAHPAAPDPTEAIFSLIARLVFLYLTFFFMQNRQHLRWALKLFIATAVVTSILILWSCLIFGFGFSRVLQAGIEARQYMGIFGLMAVYNSQSITTQAILLLTRLQEINGKRARVIVLLLAIFFLAMAFAAQFRRELLLTVPVLLLVLACGRDSVQRKSAILVLLIMSALFVVLFLNSQVLQTRLGDETTRGLQGGEGRLVSGRIGLQAFAAQPWFGYGPNAYTRTVSELDLGREPNFFYSPYNSFLLVAVEAGIVAVLGLMLIFIGTYWEVHKCQSQASGVEGWILRSAPALLVVILFWLNFGNGLQLSLPWFLLGVILAAVRLSKKDEQQLSRGF